MGAWGTGIFDNDGAGDLIANLRETDDLSVLEEAFDMVLDTGEDYLEVDGGQEALAAAALICRLRGSGDDYLTDDDDIAAWVERARPMLTESLAQKAREAVERTVTEPSEIIELWQDTDDFDAWQATVDDLSSRF
jgi:hypothetical protein